MLSKHFISLIICLLFLFQGSLYAQEDRLFSAGAVLGINASQIQGDAFAGYHKLGLLTGLTVHVRFAKKTNLGIDILYSQLGSRSALSTSSTADPFKFNLDYMSVPVYVIYKDWYDEEEKFYKIHFQGGLSYGRLFGSVVESDDAALVASQDFFKKNYLGILFGTTFNLTNHWGIGARWQRGLLRLYKNDLDNPDQPNLRFPLWDKHLSFFIVYTL